MIFHNSDGHYSCLRIYVATMILFCCSQTMAQTVDEAWNAAPPTNDTVWAQKYAANVDRADGGDGAKYKVSTYSGNWGSSAEFGWHHWCAMTAHTANGDRGTGWNLYSTGTDPVSTKSYWRVTYYNISSWGVTCYDVL
ncbi:hypothetical protein GL272_22195 [Aeromonas veronii]|uniref:hypothetical protein n=1 Tax=Aeromonas veronii TaxID=654 RepID=UPI001C5BA92D|nr:hypothetical protein [Aeromonas veronii]MBW3779585.1 hypothetical protein [Aeromonas veronii]